MSHNVVVVEFEDCLRLYAINDGGSCQLYRFLLRTNEEAIAWIFDKTHSTPDEPNDVANTAEPVLLDPDEPWSFPSRASREHLWISGPRNSDEAIAEDGWYDSGMYSI